MKFADIAKIDHNSIFIGYNEHKFSKLNLFVLEIKIKLPIFDLDEQLIQHS